MADPLVFNTLDANLACFIALFLQLPLDSFDGVQPDSLEAMKPFPWVESQLRPSLQINLVLEGCTDPNVFLLERSVHLVVTIVKFARNCHLGH